MKPCPICNQAAPTGRPKRHCGPVCRRLAESSLRRLEGKLTEVENLLFDVRHSRSEIPYTELPKSEHIVELEGKRAALIADITAVIELEG